MSRFVHHRDMTANEIIQCGYDAMAIVALCEVAAREGSGGLGGTLAGDIAIALKLAGELIAVLHDTVEIHEGLIEGTRRERVS
jgi:hypothetical protein